RPAGAAAASPGPARPPPPARRAQTPPGKPSTRRECRRCAPEKSGFYRNRGREKACRTEISTLSSRSRRCPPAARRGAYPALAATR
nr:hypothetical protein [Tanacetum cinerariifolium]